MSATGMELFLCYIISVGYCYGVIPMLYYLCLLLVWCYSYVILLVSATGMELFPCYIISVGYWYGVIPMLYY